MRYFAHVMCLCVQAVLCKTRTVRYPHNGLPTVVRVGMHTGSCVSGLIGTKLPKFRWVTSRYCCVWNVFTMVD